MNRHVLRNGCTIVALLFSITVAAEDSYSPYAGQTYPANVYFGDTHLHTNLSMDADGYGNQDIGADDAYRFARGEVVTSQNVEKRVCKGRWIFWLLLTMPSTWVSCIA